MDIRKFAAAAVLSAAALVSRARTGNVETDLPHRPEDGMRDVFKATAFARDKKWKEGAEFIAGLRSGAQARAGLEARQAVDMAEYALYKDVPAKRDACVKALKAAYKAGPSSFWGWAAYTFLEDMGENVPQPRRDPLRGLGKFGDGVVNLAVRLPSPLPADRAAEAKGAAARMLAEETARIGSGADGKDFEKGSRRLRALLRSRLIDLCGAETVEKILATRGGAERFKRLWSDDGALYDFFMSGPVFEPSSALETLMAIWLNDTDGWSRTELGRRITIAVALNSRKGKNGEIDFTATVRHWAAFRRIAQYGRFHPAALKQDCREWRFAVRQPRDPADTLYLNTRPFPKRLVHNVIFNVPYRKRNCFGASKWSKEFMRPWEASGLPMQYLRTRVGGVCTEQSMWGALLANAHGLMAERAGQPGHCCWLLRKGKGAPWRIYSNIRPFTQGVFVFWGSGFQYIQAVERAFADRKAHDASEALLFLADRMEKSGAPRDAVFALRRKAALRCPYNVSAWESYTCAMESRPYDAAAWRAYLDELFAGAPEGRLVSWDFAQRALSAMERGGMAPEALAGETKRLIAALPQPSSYIAEEMNYSRSALDRALNRFRRRKDLQIDILAAAVAANKNSGFYLGHTFKCAIGRFAKDGKSLDAFVSAAAGLVGGGGKMDWRRLFLKAGCLKDRLSFRAVASIRDRIDPPPPGEAVPAQDFGARLISADALLGVSAGGRDDTPQDYPRVTDLTPVDPARKRLFSTKASAEPWAKVSLAGHADVAGIAVKGSAPRLSIWVSDDGKDWKEVFKSQGEAVDPRVDLSKAPVRAKFVKCGMPDGPAASLGLKKILVYGRTYY